MNSIRIFVSLVLALVFALGQVGAWAASAEEGKIAFVKNGCWQCHGFQGQGGAGLKLAPDPKPIEFMAVFVRHTKGSMPPYSEKILSNEDLANIHAYLLSLPKSPDAKNIPLLN